VRKSSWRGGQSDSKPPNKSRALGFPNNRGIALCQSSGFCAPPPSKRRTARAEVHFDSRNITALGPLTADSQCLAGERDAGSSRLLQSGPRVAASWEARGGAGPLSHFTDSSQASAQRFLHASSTPGTLKVLLTMVSKQVLARELNPRTLVYCSNPKT